MPGRNDVPVTLVTQPRPSRVGRSIAVAAVAVLVAGIGIPRLAGLLPSISNPFGTETVDRTQPALLESLVDLSQYRAASANFQVIVDTEKDARFIPSFIKGERTVFVAGGGVDAHVDFSGLDQRAITVSEDRRSVSVVLPTPALDGARVNPEQSRVVSRERGVLDRIASVFSDSPTSERPLLLAAEKKMQAAAAESDLRSRAEENTRRMLESMLRSLGFTSVSVAFAANPA